jgi:protocatechuate 3,4-dioxygenase beta subunit
LHSDKEQPRGTERVDDEVSDAAAVDGELASMSTRCTVCRVWAEQDEGPYYREPQPRRRNVVEDRDGVAVQLGIRLVNDDGTPVLGADVEVWQCDALGRYSGFPPPAPSAVSAEHAPRTEYLPDQTFLRGRQTSDAAGMVEFRTIYPGWYPGRTVHVHLMVHVAGATLTSQLYFPDALSDDVHALVPYADRPGRDTTNSSDEIFPTGGDPAVLDIDPVADGYRAAIALVLPATELS